MKRTSMGVVCLCMAAYICAQEIPRSTLPIYTGSYLEDQRTDLIKAKTTRAAGIIVTLAGIATTAIGIEMEINRSRYTITHTNKSVYLF